jgi:hypothetical protein
LQPSPHNAFVQCFASQRRVYQNTFTQIQKLDEAQLSQSAWALVAGLQSQREQKGKIMKAQAEELTAERLIEIGSETRKFVLATLSAADKRQVIADMPPEERLVGLDSEEIEQLVEKVPLEQRLAGLAPEDRLAGLAPEERLAGITLAEAAKLIEQLEYFLSQQQTSDQ